MNGIFADPSKGEFSDINAFYRIKGTNNFGTLDTLVVKKAAVTIL